MTRNQGLLRTVTPDDLYDLLAEEVIQDVRGTLETATDGQRLRITTLPEPVMTRLCERLHGNPRWAVRMLIADGARQPWHASATKVIELRNTLREPLLVFIPPGLRTAAEDSLDIATFTELSLTTVPTQLAKALDRQVPEPVRSVLHEAIEYLRREGAIRNADEEVRYRLAVVRNGATAEAAGGALFVFGLVPDFDLSVRGSVPNWLSRNLKARDVLSDLRQPLQSRIARLPLAPNSVQRPLFQFLRNRQARDPREWTLEIACDSQWRHLSFDQWRFVDQPESSEVRLIVEGLGLPLQVPDQVGGAVQLPVLNLEAGRGLKVSFRSIPPPDQVPGWKTYRVQILRVDLEQPTVAWESNSYPRPAGRNRIISRTLKTADLRGLEEGTYFVKVDAYDQDGALLTRAQPLDPADASSRKENESEPFLIVHEGTAVDPPEPRAVNVVSLIDGWALAAARAVAARENDSSPPDSRLATGNWLESRGAPARGNVHFQLEGPLAGYTVVVPAILRKIELEILENPDATGPFRMNLERVVDAGDAEIERRGSGSLLSTPALVAFTEARRAVFSRLREQHLARNEDGDTGHRLSIVETADLVSLTPLIETYARAFVSAVEEASNPGEHAPGFARLLTDLDVVEVRWRPSVGDPGRALLLAPTHPLRTLWHLQHATLCTQAIEAWRDGTHQVPSWRLFVERLRRGLLPVNLPMVLLDGRGRGYVEREPLTPHWGLYLPDRGSGGELLDSAAGRDNVRRHLGLGRPFVGELSIGAHDIANRAFEYLLQHPYVEDLHINVFNPGDGELITDALRGIERLRLAIAPRREAPALRYSIQMFAFHEHLDLLGDAFEQLLDPDRQVGEDDEFTLASGHLRPKLVFGRHLIREFLDQPSAFSAHLSIFLEQFGVRVQLGGVEDFRRGSYVEGLVQEPETLREPGVSRFGWRKGLRPETRQPAGMREDLLRDCVEATQRAQATAATGEGVTRSRAPIIALRLEPESQALLTQAHAVSDWVLTVDRNLGLDFFDSPAAAEETAYLLDYAPEYVQEDRQRIMLTTRSTVELESFVRPALERFGVTLTPGDELVVLEGLRSLSGRIALRLLSAPTQSAEVVGLLLARWLLEHNGLLIDRIIVPLDAHQQWFREGEDSSDLRRRRADLLVVGLDSATKTVDALIVEVKLRDEAGSRGGLYAEMRAQAEATEERLRERFDPDQFPRPRADLALQGKELSSTLAFYVRRAARYQLLTQEAEAAVLDFVTQLDAGYRFNVRSIGVLFERVGVGSHVDEEEPGFPVHRFGLDVAQQLLVWARERVLATRGETKGGGREPTGQSGPRATGGDTRASAHRDASFQAFTVAVAGRITRRPASGDPPGEVQPEPAVSVTTQNQTEVAPPTTTEFEVSAPTIRPTPADELARPPAAAEEAQTAVEVLLGTTHMTPQFGVLGRSGDVRIGIDLTGCNTISLFGVQGFGKSYTLGVIAEMATMAVPGINALPSPLASVIFHYHKSDAYAPEYGSAVAPNEKPREVERLYADYGARPHGLTDVVLLTPEAKIADRQREFPRIDVRALKFASAEIGAEGWKFLLGAYGNEALYIRQLVAIMRRHRGELTLARLKQDLGQAALSASARVLADQRIAFAEPYIDDAAPLGGLLRPGRTVIVDLRDEWVERDEALGLFVVLLRIFAATRHGGHEFNKLVVFDEAHKYITESELIGQVVETIREMRHQATTVVIASQDPLSVPRAVLELSSMLMLHRMTSPQWLRHLKGAIAALDDVSESQLSALQPGEALVWAQRSTDRRYTQRPQKVQIRPRFTQHGGGTKVAVSGATVR
jgi:hypothetical protein